MQKETITTINQVIATYFESHEKEDIVPVKILMSEFIKAGIFIRDEKNGQPLRKVLRALDKENELEQIPRLHAERKGKNTHWYFVREGKTYMSKFPNDIGVSKKKKVSKIKSESDEHYVINLSDQLLDTEGLRQYRFSFILGEYHKDGSTRSPLSVSAYYPAYNLVLEFIKPIEAISIDRPKNKTYSGYTRAELQPLYAARKKNGLVGKGVNFIEIDHKIFSLDEQARIIKDDNNDLEVMRELLKDFIGVLD